MKTPTPEQIAIVSCRSNVQLIDAVAGSGKTTTLAMVAKNWISQGPTGRIACLSFTESAKRRLKEKLAEEGVPNNIAPATLIEYAEFVTECLIRAGYMEAPTRIASATDIRGHIVDAAKVAWRKYEEGRQTDFDFAFEGNTNRIDQLLRILRGLKYKLHTLHFDDEDFQTSGVHQMSEESDLPVEVIEICLVHERMRRQRSETYDWQSKDDIITDLVRFLRLQPEAVSAVPRVSIFLVDEWHDVNAAEFELIRSLKRDGRLVVVADRDQVIDEERGAELRLSTHDFANAYPSFQQLPLSRSHRFGASLARKLKGVAFRKVESMGEHHTTLRTIRYDPTVRTGCAESVVEHIGALNSERFNVKLSHIAVILRAEDQSIEIENALLDSAIPYCCDGITSYLVRPEILMLRALLHFVSKNYEVLRKDPQTVRHMVGALATFISYSQSKADWVNDYHDVAINRRLDPLEQAKETISKEPSTLNSFFTGVLCQVKEYDQASTRKWKLHFAQFVRGLSDIDLTTSAASLLERFEEELDLGKMVHRAVLQRGDADSAIRSIKSFIEFARKFPKHTASEFLEELSDRQRKVAANVAGQRRRHLVRLATVKSAKGHEWPYVILPYMQINEFPRGSDLLEERRYLYVAMTRAQESLTIAEPLEEFASYRSQLNYN